MKSPSGWIIRSAIYLVCLLAMLFCCAEQGDGLANVPPMLIPQDRIDAAHGDAKLGGDCGTVAALSLNVQCANLGNVSFSEFAHAVPRTTIVRVFPSSFARHIFHVELVCSKEKMLWPHTLRIVAGVTDETAIRNFAKMQLPSDAVSAFVPSAGNLQTAIAVFAFALCAAHPQPAGICFLHIAPESLGKRYELFRGFLVALLTTEFAA